MNQPQVVVTIGDIIGLVIGGIVVIGFVFLAIGQVFGWLLKLTETNDPKPEEMYSVGTMATIIKTLKLSDGKIKILVQGLSKGKIKEFIWKKLIYFVKIEELVEPPIHELDSETEALIRIVKERSEEILSLKGVLSADISAILDGIDDPGRLADIIISNLNSTTTILITQ